MKANIRGVIEDIDLCWKAFEYKGNPMTKNQVIEITIYCLLKGYINMSELTDSDYEYYFDINI